MIRVALLLALCLALPAQAIDRDRNERNAFKRSHPCPANGKVYGACPGWEVDHIIPLKCGGPDRRTNMQWLTKPAHKAKSKREARDCRKH